MGHQKPTEAVRGCVDRASGMTQWIIVGVSSRLALLLVTTLLLTPLPALSQQTGTITGQVVDARSAAPISAAQVFLEASGIGTLTGQDGRFMLLNVPAGSYTLQVERIGYAAVTREITVPAEGSIQADVELEETALGLDELVVTGTAGAARRREIGNSIEQINLADVPEPVLSTNSLLQGRSAGVSVVQTTGQVGGGAAIRLRGNVSALMSNQPLIYVDGVRIRSEGFPKNTAPIGYPGNSDNTQYSPLNDIDPNQIERIEVIKGPAATTLYGTEAAAGVIQIFTRRGRQGRATWTLQTDQSLRRVQPFGPTEGFDGEPLDIPDNEVNPYGTPDFMYLEPWLGTGWTQKYALSVSGGLEDVQYYVSGSWQDETGVLPNDWLERGGIRGNLSFSPLDGLQIAWNTSYARSRTRKTPTGGTALGITLNAFRRDRNYFNNKDPEVISQVLDFDLRTFIDHLITGVTATYSPIAPLTNRLTIGYDLAEQESRGLMPFGFFFTPTGQIHDQRWQSRTTTIDYVGSLDFGITDRLQSTFSWGGQSVTTEETATTGFSQNFPGPGQPTVSSGSISLGFEERMRVINAGFFFQNVFDLDDRYFLTLGIRFDGNSAFGENLGLQAYPKVSGSYVMSDEAFWPDEWGTVKLRAAYGQAGRAPGAFDAVRTWQPTNLGAEVAFLPNNVGNSDLGPERTAEFEVGFDGSFIDERLTLDFSYYNQRTTDALFAVRQIPSDGGWSSQLENVGELTNTGIELSANATLIRRAGLGWDVGGTLTTNHSEVLDLGGAAPFSLGNRGYIAEGQPVPVMRVDCIANADEIAEPVIEPDCDIGPNRPTLIFSAYTRLRLPWDITVSTRGEYQGGNYAYSLMDGESITRGIRWPACFNSYPEIDAGDLSAVTARERALCIAANADRDFAVFPMDFFRMRELTVSAPVPVRIPGTTDARLLFSAQNFFTWKKAKYSFLDPETSGGFSSDQNVGMNARVHTVGGSIALPATYTASIRVSF